MTADALSLPISDGRPTEVKKKKVLLIDTSPRKRDLRAEIMRKLGMDVDCAADISEARCRWRPDLYDLVLISAGDDLAPGSRFCENLRSATPPQQLAYLVGKPEYLADLPDGDGTPPNQNDDNPALVSNVKAALLMDVSDGRTQRWGIMEACRRISAVRSVVDARSRAIRDRPAPPRDSEIRPLKQPIVSLTLDELLREEMP
jgi:CheY-like chemotaxis protein